LKRFRLGFIGVGAMGNAILSGVIKSSIYKSDEIAIYDLDSKKLYEICSLYGVVKTEDQEELVVNTDIIILAVKPQQIANVLLTIPYLNPRDENRVFVSIAAGIPTKKIEDYLGVTPVVRAMPNSPALIGEGMTVLSPGRYVSKTNMEKVEKLFSASGKTMVLEEYYMDAVTGVSGSGPAYVYQFIEAMADAAVMLGISRKDAYKLVSQTVIGAGKMVQETGIHPGELKDRVTSPKGTTIRAIRVMEENGFRGIVMNAVEASYLAAQKIGND